MNFLKLGSIHDLNNDKVWTPDDIRARMNATSSQIGKGNYIIKHGNSGAFFGDLLGVWDAGGCAVVVNPGLTDNELQNVAAFTDAKAILSEDEIQIKVDICDFNKKTPTKMDDPALILFTSGTTGEPKGVVHTFRSLSARIALNQSYLGTKLYRSLSVLPTHFGHGLIGNCLTPLFAGYDIFLSRGNMHTASMLGKILRKHSITFMSSVPSFWKMVLRLSDATYSPIGKIHVGSAPLSADLWDDIMDWAGCNVANMYGITETANWIAGADSDKVNPEDGLVGRMWGGTAGVFYDDEIYFAGEGEIVVQTPSIMDGYYRRTDLTNEVWKDGWYFTGDTGHISANGNIWISGRNKYVINKGGMKIYPEEIDLLLESHPDIEEACAFGEGENVVAAVKVKKEVETLDIQSWISSQIREEAVPNRIIILDEIPKTDRGKLNRGIVKEKCAEEDRARQNRD